MSVRRAQRTSTRRRKPALATRDESKQATRVALIASGISLIHEQGLDGPSLDAICERAGYTRGAFYVHFRDRDDFIVAVMDTVGVLFMETVLAGGIQSSIARFLEAFADGSYPIGGPSGIVRPHQLLEACARSSTIRERYVNIVAMCIDRVAGMVAEDQQSGSLRGSVGARAIAEMMTALGIGLHTLRDLEVPIDLAAIARTLQSLLDAHSLGGIGTRTKS
jgi:TetR/AcrR family transcriptional regulator, transcriptional repressor for nem operon